MRKNGVKPVALLGVVLGLQITEGSSVSHLRPNLFSLLKILGTNGLLAGGVVGGSVEQLIDVGGTALRKLVHQVPACRALEEGIDDLDMGDAGELGALLAEVPHVVTQGLIGLLPAPFDVPGVPRAHVRALEVAHKDLD
jgi:hypothetical protein